MTERVLPEIEEILFAMSEEPLGRGEEATVYKIHTSPHYTVRVSHEAPDFETLAERLYEEKFTQQEDIFEGRNYAQPVAYWGLDEVDNSRAMVTINLYAPGISMEIHKPGRDLPPDEVALMKTMALSKAILNMPDSAIDKLYDDLHFLSSREYSIDVGNGGLFTNTGNILYSGNDKEFRIIDIQPFLRDRVGIPRNHTKGFNTPLFLARGLLPGAYGYAEKHAKYPPLIEDRTEIIERIISGAERNHINDLGGYLKGDMEDMANFWKIQLKRICIPEERSEDFVRRICSVKQENRYEPYKKHMSLIRVAGRSMMS